MLSASANEVVSSEATYFLSLSDKEISLTALLLYLSVIPRLFFYRHLGCFTLYTHQAGQSLFVRIAVLLIGSVSVRGCAEDAM